MKEKEMKEKLDELRNLLEEALDETGLRDEFEKYRKHRKPEFKIYMKSHSNGEGCTIEVVGNKPSLMLALAELSTSLMRETNLTAEDIREAINMGIKHVEDEEE